MSVTENLYNDAQTFETFRQYIVFSYCSIIFYELIILNNLNLDNSDYLVIRTQIYFLVALMDSLGTSLKA